jgi:hypothetical protein
MRMHFRGVKSPPLQSTQIVSLHYTKKVTNFMKAATNKNNTKIRKEKRQERSKWKKPLKLIRENFIPRLVRK